MSQSKEQQKPPPTAEELRREIQRLSRTHQFLMSLGDRQPANAFTRTTNLNNLRNLAPLARQADRDAAARQGYNLWDLDYEDAHIPGTDFDRLSQAVQQAHARARFNK